MCNVNAVSTHTKEKTHTTSTIVDDGKLHDKHLGNTWRACAIWKGTLLARSYSLPVTPDFIIMLYICIDKNNIHNYV